MLQRPKKEKKKIFLPHRQKNPIASLFNIIQYYLAKPIKRANPEQRFAKRFDRFSGWHIHPINSRFDPSTSDSIYTLITPRVSTACAAYTRRSLTYGNENRSN